MFPAFPLARIAAFQPLHPLSKFAAPEASRILSLQVIALRSALWVGSWYFSRGGHKYSALHAYGPPSVIRPHYAACCGHFHELH
jgi:hypothetical protein